MLKLYKFESDKVNYWEAWENEGEVFIHWGELGTTGETKTATVKNEQSVESLIEENAEIQRGNGYRELNEGEEVTLILQYEVDGFGTPEDLDNRYRIEELLNGCLGWTGNGICDGGDIGSGTMNIFSLVVNPYIAAKTIIEELRENGALEGAVMAIELEDSFEVLYPDNHDREFSYWYEPS